MSHRFDAFITGFVAPGILYNRRADPSGVSVLDIWSVESEPYRGTGM
jgi:hypothetical protein